MLNVDMLVAGHGDAILVEYGRDPVRRILIDGGPWFAYDYSGGLRDRLAQLCERGEATFELLIVTHVDTDHIDGIIKLLQDPEFKSVKFKDIWFNGWKHVQKQATGVLGPLHGEFLGALLEDRKLPWNAHEKLAGGPIMVPPGDGPLPTLELDGGAIVTVVSPGPLQLEELRKAWPKGLKRAGFTGSRERDNVLEELKKRARYGPPKGVLGDEPDDSAANGSSIAIIIEHDGDRALLAGDAFAPVLANSLARYANEPLELTDFKLPHHGSFSNVNKKLIKAVRPQRYLISSSGQFYGHPDEKAIKLILKHHVGGPPELVFNYCSPKTLPWFEADTDKYTVTFSTNATWKPKRPT